jgi:hypothetical protein
VNVGFIGLGHMGAGMATNLLRAGLLASLRGAGAEGGGHESRRQGSLGYRGGAVETCSSLYSGTTMSIASGRVSAVMSRFRMVVLSPRGLVFPILAETHCAPSTRPLPPSQA